MDIRRILAINIVRLRRAKGLSQEALAWEAAVARSYMVKIETAKTSTGLDVIGKLAAVLKVDPDELLRPPPRRQPKARAGKPKS
jgi:transcriptional regulator with XRE-family HTH domain